MRGRWDRLTGAVLAALALGMGAPAAAPAQPAPPDSLFARADRLLRAGAPDSVLVLVGPLIERAVATGDSLLELHGRLHQAGALALSGRLREAEATANLARGLGEALGQPGAVQMASRWLGYALLGQGRTDDAQRTYTELGAAAAAAGNRREEAYAHMGLAYLALGRGETAAAREGYEQAAPLFDAVGEKGMALDCLVGLARTLGRDGRYGEMRDLYERIVREGEQAGLQRVVGFALNNLGTYEYQTGDPGLAVAYWQRVLEARLLGGDATATITPQLNLALAHMEMGDFDEAVGALRDLGERCREGGYRAKEAAVLAQLASLEQARGNRAGAADLWRQLMSMTEAGQDGRLEAALNLARALGHGGRSGEALALADTIAAGMLAGATPQQRAEFDLVQAVPLAALGRDAEARQLAERAYLAVRGAGFRQTEMAALLELAAAERALAAADPAAAALADSALAHLRAAQRRWADLRAAPRDPRWREQRGAVGSAIHLALATALLGDAPQDAADTSVREAFDALQGYKARTLLERMLGPDAFASEQVAARPPTLADLQRGVLAPDEVLLDFYLGDESSLMFAATRTGCRAVALPGRAALGSQVRLFLDLVAVPPDAGADVVDHQPAARRLAGELFAPVAAELQGSARVVIAADGLLNRLPFELLPLDPAADPPVALGDAREVARVPSVMVLARLRAGALPPGAQGVLVLESTDADGPDALPGAREEGRRLRRRYRDVSVVHPGCGAADGAWAADLAGRAVLHVPGHTETFDQRPWNSHIELGCGADGETCWLTSADVAGLHLEPGLAVLSGCSSAGGRALSGEGMLGLTGAFLAAGSRAVVASLWDVDDAATAAFMARFYAALADGRTASGALGAARRDLARSAPTAAPCYWAGFVVVGDGGLQVRLQKRAAGRPALLLAGAAVAAVFVSLLWVRKRRRVIPGRGRSLS